MKYYYWKETVSNQGQTSVVDVYEQMKDKSFYCISSYTSSRGSYRGGKAIAAQILHDEFGYQWLEPDGDTHYFLKRKDIELVELP